MAKSNLPAVITAKAIMESNGTRAPLPIYVPPGMKTPRQRIQERAGQNIANPIDVRTNLIRIQEESDPLGFLMAAAQGIPIPQYRLVVKVDEQTGEEVTTIETEYVILSMNERVQIMRYLGNKVLPVLTGTYMFKPPKEKDSQEPSEWDAMLTNAALKTPLIEEKPE